MNEIALRNTPTHCPYCAMQCGMMLVEDGDRWSVSARDFPTNRGGLCRKGWTAASLLNSSERLTTPLMRDTKGGALRPADWPEVLDRIADSVKSIAAEHGPDAIGVFGGSGLTNEKAYLLGKFARVALRTANIDYNGRFCMASAAPMPLSTRHRKLPNSRSAPSASNEPPWLRSLENSRTLSIHCTERMDHD